MVSRVEKKKPVTFSSFCHMCNENAGLETEDARTFQKYIANEGSQECSTEKMKQTLTFKVTRSTLPLNRKQMCTPSKSEMSERQDEEREKMQEYWNYLKQGILTAVVHVVDREEIDGSRKKQCRQMCDTYEHRKGVSSSYKVIMARNLS